MRFTPKPRGRPGWPGRTLGYDSDRSKGSTIKGGSFKEEDDEWIDWDTAKFRQVD